MIKQLRKVGNSNAIILDKPILELLGIEENAEVQLTVQNGTLIITPTNPHTVSQEKVNEILDQLVDNRRDVYQRLAQ
ncbi:MAG: hypothetical protein KDA52_25100 [Planctomycetaceae bacterium]|nr:hypothetical protein [Planctomycetaceae bacterium]